MDEKDYTIQKLARTNLALLGELHAIKMCHTCVHDKEKETHCDTGIMGLYYCPRKDGYEWRGVDAFEKWAESEEYKQMLELLVAPQEKG